MSDKKEYTLTEALLLFPASVMVMIGILLASIPFSLFSAWVRVILWGWFAVPIFHAPKIGVLPMWGISILLGEFHWSEGIDEKYKISFWTRIGYSLIASVMSLGIGYIIHICIR